MMPFMADFDRAEFEGRWRRARALMAAAGLDALFISSEANYRYLSGHVTPFWISHTRPLFFLLPLGRPPVVLVAGSQAPGVAATSHVTDVRAYQGFAGPAVDLLVATLHDLGLAGARIGAELGEEQRLGLPYLEFARLQRALPAATFLDAAPLLWRLRAIKSPAEIACLRRSAAIASVAYRELFAAVRPGMTEREVFAAFVTSTIRQGAERPGYVPVHSGAGHYARHTTGPTDRALQAGDLLWLDGGCVARGYWSDFARMVALGRATPAQRDRYRLVREAMHACVAAVAPGVAVADLVRLARDRLAAAGVELNAAGRIGHGLGLDATEPPSVALDDPTIMAPGMVLTLEPTSATDFGFFQLEENLVVTETGYELLTEPAPPELPVL